ncbi:Lipoyltransferase and lipoate-protein ligase [Coniophora puteana RWD-64-598 SS2]|uniref:Putative lipoate-protein ligase A n=1 Tax=Coniophora puteana (strain RWD-64-598) TaxID=741705 RepID=A0A5M3MC20_CONPW|nr:Lipoyltransferase and lipoate-protein ligase [Coniophora puteana RWD-64-598 SS2]EIW76191.1 Lipoyltransferase and lipoate-protein ligase [Coniophora puteana RWD-64-598 SS2]
MSPLSRLRHVLPTSCSTLSSLHRTPCYAITRQASTKVAATFSDQSKPTNSIYVSLSNDPYFNLSFEDWLFRHAPHTRPLLLLYRDTPCVIIGRNQNPWTEVNFPALQATGIPFIRRRSGGGTDLGNTNFSIHVPRTTFDRTMTAQIVLRAVRALGIPSADVNTRNDITVAGEKVSGSAYKIANNRAYHHGTMLISTRLDTLGALLRPDKVCEGIQTKGVASVRSPVCNLAKVNAETTHDAFVQAVVDEFRREYGMDEDVQYVDDGAKTQLDYVRKGMEELPSWDWAYGQTPEFTHDLAHSFSWGAVSATISSKHGRIISCAFTPARGGDADLSRELSALSERLVGAKYGFLQKELETDKQEDVRAREVASWLKEKLNL